MNRIFVIGLLCQLALPALATAQELRRSDYGIWGKGAHGGIWADWKPDLSGLQSELQSLVDRYYVDCVVKRSDGELTFALRTRSFWIHDRNRSVEWQDAREVIGPQPKGIYCTVTPRSSNIRTTAVVPQKFNRHYFVESWMKFYSPKLDGSLLVTLRYPSDVNPKFVSELESLLKRFDRFVSDKSD